MLMPYYYHSEVKKIPARIMPPPLPRPKTSSNRWVTLEEKNISLLPVTDNIIVMLTGIDANQSLESEVISPGNICSLSCEPVEGLNFDKLYFKVYALVKEYHGANLNSVVVREVHRMEDGSFVEGDNTSNERRKFSLPPSICKEFGLEYKPGYEIWSLSNNRFEKVDAYIKPIKREINHNDLSTYPVNITDGTIRKLLIKLDGFKPYNENEIITPTGVKLSTGEFLNSLSISVKQHISTDDGCAGFEKGDKLVFKVITSKNGRNVLSVFNTDNSITILASTRKQALNVKTEDGIIGISPKALEGKNINDIIEVKWEEPDINNQKTEIKGITCPNTTRLFTLLDNMQKAIENCQKQTATINIMI